jgi:predicted ATPase/class 3 adenylate cyclase
MVAGLEEHVHAPNVMRRGDPFGPRGCGGQRGGQRLPWPPVRRPPASDQPAGIVTLLFTDIEGSTRLFQRLGRRYPDLLARHHALVRESIATHEGFEVGTEGDSFFVVFRSAVDALAAAAAAQRSLAREEWPEGAGVRVRMGLHTGEVEVRDGLYVGLEIHRAARVAAAAHGGQVVLSGSTRAAGGDRLPPGTSLRDLGDHRLKDLDGPEQLHQLVIDGLRGDFPPLRSLSARFHILPSERSTFVGRVTELERIPELLASTRLLTLSGPAGTGKTRLALRVARECDARFRDGVAYVPLASISDPRLVAATIRQVLGLAEDPGREAVDTLVEQLRSRELLLVLDNFEQVLPAAADLARLLAGTDRLCVLVTSRTVLHLEGEQEFPVPPLGLPSGGRRTGREEIERSEAVALFVDRARLAEPSFRLDERNAAAVAAICRRLDGLPLAIELAAARVKVLPPDALLARLSRRLEMLQAGATDREARQRTLRGAIDWSHDLLDPALRIVFRRLAVFRGGAALDALETLVPALPVEPGEPEIGDVLDPLAALVDHSLLRREGRDGEPRFLMLETIREYGLERLAAAGEAPAMAEAHARWFLDLVASLAPHLTRGPTGPDRLEADVDNVRAALGWAIASRETALALRSVGHLWRFWHLRGHLEEGLGLCEEVLATAGAGRPGAGPAASGLPGGPSGAAPLDGAMRGDVPGDVPLEALAQGLTARAGVRYWRGDMRGALEDYRRALEIARATSSLRGEADASFSLVYVYAALRQFEAAYAAQQRASDIAAELGDPLGVVNARLVGAFVTALAGDFERAALLYQQDLPALHDMGDQFWRLSQLIPVAWTLQRLGRLDEARDLHLRVLDDALELGDGTLQHMAAQGLASIAAQWGDTGRAIRMAGGLEAMAEELGGRAPRELVLAQDPVALAREQGATEAEVALLLAQGSRLDRDAVVDLARGVRSSAG